ncbi:OmpA family protein [Sneathiella glossodoripedis]|uniref:OmpA family protein n=1 Tax=Sneathiella glossodoripedis TaxID=418853 RepID=UPI00047084DA|nr:OmpA family protein [Sneathiella glossodoripedis]
MFKRQHPKLINLSLLSTLLIALGACGTSSFEELNNASPVNDQFANALATEYRDFARSEIRQYDWPDQKLFSDKGLRVASGQRSLPERPEDWRLKDKDLPEFHQKRADLIHWLDTNGRITSPFSAAKAQRNYDCWVEQKQENWQADDIRTCRDGLKAHMPQMWQVQFPFDSSNLKAQANAQLRRIAQDWHRNPGQFLLIQGHADNLGPADYNYRLSYKRAKTVGIRLAELGVPKQAIRFEVWGESRPRSSSRQSHLLASNKVNRRVEILKFSK